MRWQTVILLSGLVGICSAIVSVAQESTPKASQQDRWDAAYRDGRRATWDVSRPATDLKSSLDLPLTIHEVAGVDRRQDICFTGVPLPCRLPREPQGIAVFHPTGQAVPAQFRVLERWRDRGDGKGDLSIRWLLVTFLADVPAGGKVVYRLKTGQNPLPQSTSRPKTRAMSGSWAAWPSRRTSRARFSWCSPTRTTRRSPPSKCR